MSQLSTAFSDLVLASSAVYGILQMTAAAWDTYAYAVIGYAIIWCAAVAGMIRFGLSDPPNKIYDLHRGIYWISHTAPIALIAAQNMQDQKVVLIALIISAILTCISNFFLHGNDDVNLHDVIFCLAIIVLAYDVYFKKSIFGGVAILILLAVRLHRRNNFESPRNYEAYAILRAVSLILIMKFFTDDKALSVFNTESKIEALIGFPNKFDLPF